MGSDDDITRFRQQPCPYCGAKLDAAGPPDTIPLGSPDPGDFVVCIYCAQPSVWVVGPLGGGLRQVTPEELAEFAVNHGHHAARVLDLRQRYPRRSC
jgi:hypothetical protein